MDILLLAILAIGTLWNAFTTVYGAMSILGDGFLQIIASLLFSALVLGFVLNTTRIIRSRGGFLGGLLTFFWFISVCYNFYTSWIGNRTLLGGDQGGGAETIILIGLTLLGASSPILLSALWDRRYPARPARETGMVDHVNV
jgi:hypothetical protein